MDTIRIGGVPIHNVTLDETLEVIEARIRARRPGFMLTPNVDHVCLCQKDPEFLAAYEAGFLSVADGMPLLWAARLLGTPLKQKISGSDLIYWLSAFAAERGHSVFFFGAAPGVAEETARRLRDRYPGLRVAGAYCPPMGFDKDPERNEEAMAVIRAAAPDICLLAVGSPRQERWIYRHHEQTGAIAHVGVGASFDFVTGVQKRAPVWMQYAGLEWLWRLAHDPARLAKRYLVDDLAFLSIVWKDWRAIRRG